MQTFLASPIRINPPRLNLPSLSLRWLRTSLLGVGFVGFMMPNATACSSTGFSMARHVASHPADNCAFDASLRLDSVRKCEAQQGGTNDQTFHDGLLRGYVRVNPSRQRFVPQQSFTITKHIVFSH